MMGVFGMLAIALMVFVLRQISDDHAWFERSNPELQEVM
jgi:nitric oxide reductase large subunit